MSVRRVVLVSDATPGASGDRFVQNLAKAIGRRADIYSIDMRHDLPAFPEAHQGVREHGLKFKIYEVDAAFGNLVPSLVFPVTRRAVKRAEKAGNIIHYTSLNVPIMSSLSRAVVTFHDSPISLFKTDYYRTPLRFRVITRLRMERYRLAQAVFVHSRHVAKGVEDFGLGPVYTVPLPVNDAFRPIPDRAGLRREFGLPEQRKLVLSVSTDEHRKNLRTTAAVVKSLGGQFALVRVGPPVEGAFNFRVLSEAALARLFNSCDVLLQPSLEEGFGLPIIEAFAVGLPVVASDIEVFGEICGHAAELREATDVAKLSEAVRLVIESADDYSARSLERARAFRFEVFREQLTRAYAKIESTLSN